MILADTGGERSRPREPRESLLDWPSHGTDFESRDLLGRLSFSQTKPFGQLLPLVVPGTVLLVPL